MSKVIVGFNASEEARDALALAMALAAAESAELHVAVVLPRSEIPFESAVAGGQLSTQLEEELFASAERILRGSDYVRASLDGGIGGRSAARALYEYAREEDAELIVVGSSQRGKLGRILLGSVGESLLRCAPCAVAVAPRGFAHGSAARLGKIGIAYDGSIEAELALNAAERLCRSMEADMSVITVVPTQPSFQFAAALSGELIEDLRAEFRGVLQAGLQKLDQRTRAEEVFAEGDPAEVLAERAADLDLLVMGSRGYGPIRGALLGAVGLMRPIGC